MMKQRFMAAMLAASALAVTGCADFGSQEHSSSGAGTRTVDSVRPARLNENHVAVGVTGGVAGGLPADPSVAPAPH